MLYLHYNLLMKFYKVITQIKFHFNVLKFIIELYKSLKKPMKIRIENNLKKKLKDI